MSAKHAINNKLQGSVGTRVRCGWVVNNQIEKGLLLNVQLKKKFIIGEYVAKLQARMWLSQHFVRLINTLLKEGKSARDNHAVCVNKWMNILFLNTDTIQ